MRGDLRRGRGKGARAWPRVCTKENQNNNLSFERDDFSSSTVTIALEPTYLYAWYSSTMVLEYRTTRTIRARITGV